MLTLKPIRRTLFSPEGQSILDERPAPETFSGPMAYARAVCEHFEFIDAHETLRVSSCIAALRDLEAAGRITLPPGGARKQASSRPLMLPKPVPPVKGVPTRVDAVLGFAVQLVETKADARLLARLLHDEYPQGGTQHSGRQLRYLITSAHGVLGGFVFASAAQKLRPRDQWVGWNPEQCRSQLYRVVGLSRFLIRTQVQCAHLASKALAHCLRQLPTDFAARYNIVPVLCETFTSAVYAGTSLAASGWTYVGQSSGRGRYSLPGQETERKGIWLRPLCRDWRTQLGVFESSFVPPPRPKRILAPSEGLATAVWAENEFGAMPLNKALVKRLVKSVRIQAMVPSETFLSAASGDQAAVIGYYRMIDRRDTETFTPEAILTTHRVRSLCRLRAAKTVLLIQDGLDLNFATHRASEGFGEMSRTNGSKGILGIHMHSTFAVNEDGVPLGVPRIEFAWSNGKAETDKATKDGKFDYRLRGWRDSSELAAKAPDARVISVMDMDHEGDVDALFAERHAKGGAELLVRAKHDHVFSNGHELFDRLRISPPQAEHEIRVDRASARRSPHNQKAFAGRNARLAQTQVRWRVINLPEPKRQLTRLRIESFPLTAVHVIEPNPPNQVEPVEWLLLTTLPVTNRSEAIAVLDSYALRWRIEDWYQILKNGCEVEKIAHSTADRIKRAVTINAVIAWRLSVLALLGRTTPEIKALPLFEQSEVAVLLDYAGDMGFQLPCQKNPEHPPAMDEVSLGEAVLLIARLGGYLNRKNDAAPGHEVMWNGYSRLRAAAQTLERSIRQGDQSVQKMLLGQ